MPNGSIAHLPPPTQDEHAEQIYRKYLVATGVPSQLHDGLVLYLTDGVRPGSFLTAVLENDLITAVRRGDPECRAQLAPIVDFLLRHVPIRAWGSAENVATWIVNHRTPQESR